MQSNNEIAQAFFQAYQAHDARLMCALLAPDAQFSDLAFPALTGERLRRMWIWFCSKTDKRGPIDVPGFAIVKTDGTKVHARYRVTYPLEGRTVDYWIRSELTLRDGRIVAQKDEPDIWKWRWAWMVAGFPKCLAAYTEKFDKALQQVMRQKLDAREAASVTAGTQ